MAEEGDFMRNIEGEITSRDRIINELKDDIKNLKDIIYQNNLEQP